MDSDRPTTRPTPRKPTFSGGIVARVERYHRFGQSLVGTLIALGTAMVFAFNHIQSYATDTEMAVAVAVHSNDATAHADLREKLNALGKRVERCETDGIQQVQLWRRMIRLLAADREDNRHLKAAAASFYEDEFRRRVGSGEQPDSALVNALRTPWTDRPRRSSRR